MNQDYSSWNGEISLILTVIEQNWNLLYVFFKKGGRYLFDKGININKIIKGKFKLLKRIKYNRLIILWKKIHQNFKQQSNQTIQKGREVGKGIIRDTLCRTRIDKLCRKFNIIFSPSVFFQKQ